MGKKNVTLLFVKKWSKASWVKRLSFLSFQGAGRGIVLDLDLWNSRYNPISAPFDLKQLTGNAWLHKTLRPRYHLTSVNLVCYFTSLWPQIETHIFYNSIGFQRDTEWGDSVAFRWVLGSLGAHKVNLTLRQTNLLSDGVFRGEGWSGGGQWACLKSLTVILRQLQVAR